MANDFGITDAGFRIKTADDIELDLQEAMKAEYGQDVILSADSVLGRQVSINKEALSEIWELAQAGYQSQYRDSAEGFSLDNAAALLGLTRLPATKSTVLLTASGTPGTVLPIGRVVSVPATGERFETTTAATIGGGGTIDVTAESQNFGAIQGVAGTITQIETPVSGWTSVTNAIDAVLGRVIESDAAFRLRIEQSLQIIGAATVDAIRARIRNDVDGVLDAFVFENDTDAVDGGGRPPHSFEAVVAGGADQDIWDKIWEVKAAGIATFGTESGTALDSQGNPHTVNFSRATQIPIWMHVELKVDALFDQGAAQDDLVTIDTVSDLTLYTITINGIDFDFTSDASATDDEITAGLTSAINTGTWVPVTATDNVDGTLSLVSDLPGNAFTVSLTAEMSLSNVTANAGDQANVIAEIIKFAEGDEDTLPEQVIGADVIIDKYNVPIFNVANITEVTIYIASSQPTDEPPGAPWILTNFVINSTELATFDTTRTTVEIIP